MGLLPEILETQKKLMEIVKFKTFNPWYRTMQIMLKNQIYQNCTQNSANKITNFSKFNNFSDFPHKKITSNVPHELENVNFI